MAAPTLNDYEYQFKDDGFLLNGDTAMPFIDVNKVTGLDLPPFTANIDDIDSQHGGVVHVNSSQVRTIVVDGTLYADPSTIEQTVDTLISNYLPSDTNYPFYFKHPGVDQRYCNGKSLGIKMDVEQLRRIGASAVQIQVACEDPRKYVDNDDQLMTANTNYTPDNNGNVSTYPIFTIVGAMTSITLTNNAQSRSVILTTTRTSGDITIVDFRRRTVTINGVQSSNVVTTANWWDIPPGGGQSVKYTVTGGPPTSVTMSTRQGWM